jgi:hypothetical protein
MSDGFDPGRFAVRAFEDAAERVYYRLRCLDCPIGRVAEWVEAEPRLSVIVITAHDHWAERHRLDAPVCGSRCPVRDHDHGCARSPGHLSECRDVKQKGRESCSWDVPHGDRYTR